MIADAKSLVKENLIGLHDLPAVNATLNGTAAVLLVIAYTLIRKGQAQAHKRVMLAAFGVSTVFLICYLTYHWYLVAHNEVRAALSGHTALIRTIYLTS